MSDHKPVEPGKVQRQKRLEDQLRENLRKRKVQAKARRSAMDAEPDTDIGPDIDIGSRGGGEQPGPDAEKP